MKPQMHADEPRYSQHGFRQRHAGGTPRSTAYISGSGTGFARFLSCSLLLPLAFVLAGEAAAETAPTPAAPKPAFDPVEVQLNAGRECFRKRDYAAAFEKFSQALALKPAHREARFLAGLAAYWAKRPEQALEYWNGSLDSAPRGSAEEWRLETSRVMALFALGQLDAAEQVVARLYELRQKVAEAKKAQGFVRENLQIADCRVGCWEVFDERHEAQEIWSFPVVALAPADEPIVACLGVAPALLPDGKAGVVLNEEGRGYTRVYKHWAQRPSYAEVRAVLLDVLQGKVQPLEEKKADNADTFPSAAAEALLPWHAGSRSQQQRAAPGSQQPGPPPGRPKQRILSEVELGSALKVQALGLDAEAASILTVAARLRDIEFDVTRLTRLSLTDKLLAERCLGELKAKAPFAPEDAAELVELLSKAKAEHVRAACEKLSKLGARQPYLDYALLTAFTTRGRDVPTAFLKDSLKSRDFMVRQTAALLLARAGDLRGLTQLFKELESADALGCTILLGSIEELVSTELGAPPAARSASAGAGLNEAEELALKAWQQKAAAWWRENGERLKFADGQWTAGSKK